MDMFDGVEAIFTFDDEIFQSIDWFEHIGHIQK